MDVLDRLVAGDAVLGVVLTGSHARGMATSHSDVDVTVVVAGEEARWRHVTRTAELDQVECTVAALADTSDRWQRYAYRGARVLLDRLGGRIAELVARQATPTAEEAAGQAAEALDGYVNLLYRAVKSRRDGRPAAARLDELESLPWLLETVFALHGRLRPYNKYLRWELDTHPLPGGWTGALDPERLPDRALRLFPEVEALARTAGHGAALDSWGDDIALIRAAAGGS